MNSVNITVILLVVWYLNDPRKIHNRQIDCCIAAHLDPQHILAKGWTRLHGAIAFETYEFSSCFNDSGKLMEVFQTADKSLNPSLKASSR